MKTYLKFLVVIPWLISCVNNEQAGGEQKEFITDAAPETDSLVNKSFSPELKSDLEDYFSSGMIDELDQFVTNYNAMKTDTDFEKVYTDGLEIMKSIYSDLETPKTENLINKSRQYEYWSPIEILDELQDFNGHLGPLEISCVAECTELDILFDLKALHERSEMTDGTGDDDFMRLLTSIEGNYGFAGYYGFKSWFNQTWDYGGSSLIGNDTLLHCIERCMAYKNDYELFESQLELIYADFVNALLYENNYSYSQEIVLKEYDAILDLNFFKPEDTKKIKERYQVIKKGGDPFQFECETNDCVFG